MTPHQFIDKWTKVELSERSACQSHFNDLCDLLGDPDADGVGTVRYPRLVPKDDAAAHLKKRTLTALYNDRPAWLANTHKTLDEAVSAAYGWPPGLPDEELLARLLDLNLSRTDG